ncbi:hypothetical protein NDU88_003426 [Pleurodeles waltl]|uniref:Uncharacterized protein n=1 Tax=Pleurodeles waltl TaxID=8319 RepID=A0AAV7M3C6_PLEWA|nr:hypothetical protein NDU88_003426 [Pleurodeles waltl]
MRSLTSVFTVDCLVVDTFDVGIKEKEKVVDNIVSVVVIDNTAVYVLVIDGGVLNNGLSAEGAEAAFLKECTSGGGGGVSEDDLEAFFEEVSITFLYFFEEEILPF